MIIIKKYLYLLAISGLSAFPVLVHSQKKSDTLHLKEVEIKSSFTLRTDGFKKIIIDSSLLSPQLNTDLSTILSQHSTVFIKTYGNGSLATPSMRGTTASHTHVEWNGISINSPMLGMSDFSQIPAFQFNDVEILYGAAGIQKTGGAFGGVINLVTNPEWENRLRVVMSQTSGSFDTYTDNLAVAAGNDKLQSISKIYYSFSKNNFPFFDDKGVKHLQKNGEYEYAGGSEEFFFRITPKDYISTRIWFNYAFINLPPPLSGSLSGVKETQENHDLYSKIEWKHLGKKSVLTVWSGMVDHFMQYIISNSSAENVNDHHSYSWLNKVRWNYTGIKKVIIRPGIDVNYDWVKSDGYDDLKNRNTISGFSEFILKYPERFSFNLILRQDIMDNVFLPTIAALGAEYDPLKSHNLSVTLNISKNYKYPTLNDLYWETFGNPDLKPETDYAAEAGVVFQLPATKKVFFIETEITGYYSKMENLILWKPGVSGLFRPTNVPEVVARGIETGLNFRIEKGIIQFSLNNNYHYCRSTNEKSLSPNDGSKGKQIIYIPVHTFNTTATAKMKGYYLTYNFSFFSERYTSTKNESYMPAYNVSNIIIGKNFHFSEILLSLQLQINNLFGLDYQSIANRPMPGRNMAITLKFNFGK